MINNIIEIQTYRKYVFVISECVEKYGIAWYINLYITIFISTFPLKMYLNIYFLIIKEYEKKNNIENINTKRYTMMGKWLWYDV